MELRPIRTEAQYDEALHEVSSYFDHEPIPGTAESDHFEVLTMLIEAYEKEHYPITSPDPIDAINFRMEQAGLTPKDLAPLIGQLNRVYEVLTRKRPLTLAMIRRLHDGLGIPAESLIAKSRQKTVITRLDTLANV